MVFLTPTVVKGDATGAQVVAHELAHSWTGNLITNKNNEHFWLNEVLCCCMFGFMSGYLKNGVEMSKISASLVVQINFSSPNIR